MLRVIKNDLFFFLFLFLNLFSSCSKTNQSSPVSASSQSAEISFSTFTKSLDTKCTEEKSNEGISYEYCMLQHQDAHHQNKIEFPKIIYYFHGIFGDAESSLPFIKNILFEWSKQSKTQTTSLPIIVAVSFGRTFFLTSKSRKFLNGNSVSNYYTIFKDEFIPQIEKKLGMIENLPVDRMLWGTSMGGFNALLMLLKNSVVAENHLNFSKVILDCPALFTVTPYSTFDEQKDFLKKYKEVLDRKILILEGYPFFLKEFPKISYWEAENPYNILKNIDSSFFEKSKIYMTASESDEWGFYPGALTLKDKLNENNFTNVQFRSQPGKHCQFSQVEQVQFLLKD